MEAIHRCCANCPCTRNFLKREYLKCNISSVCDGSQELHIHQKPGVETYQHKTKCNQCKKTIQDIRNLLDEFLATKEINASTTCKCCKRVLKSKYCQKCDAVGYKFLACQDERTKVKTFTEWLLKLKYLLTTLLQSHSICQHMNSTDTDLERILNEIRSPICVRKPVIEYFPDIGEHQLFTQSISESKDLLDILLSRIEPESDETPISLSDNDSISSCRESCICKLLKKEKPKVSVPESTIDFNIDTNLKVPTQVPSIELNIKDKPKKSIQLPTKEVGVGKKMNKNKVTVTAQKSDKERTSIHEKSDLLLKKMLEKRENSAERRKENLKNNIPKTYDKDKDEMQKLVDKQLADALAGQTQVQETKSSTFLECEVESTSPKYIVKSTCLLPFDLFNKVNESSQLHTRREFIFESLEDGGIKTPTATPLEETSKRDKKTSGIITYQLSDRTFINNGWTELPHDKIVRRMNLYKMDPVDPENNWFERFKNKKTIYYNTGEILANINDDGYAKWFYTNGSVALEYYDSSEIKNGCRCMVYGYKTDAFDSTKQSLPITLAMFDFHGNGVIYDTSGNIRLKYNQSEGVLVDPGIGFPSRWKWHGLNDPPVLKMLRVDSHLDPKDPVIQKLNVDSYLKSSKSSPPSSPSAEEMMQEIEAENLVKNKVKSNFKQCVMMARVVKLNECFAIRISAQTKILLTYRCRSTVLKLNLGMTLNSKKIVGFNFSEANEVELLYPNDRRTPF
ncbi:unnamed protein product [Arctia plantaginis]|uniref:FAM194 C-terminal domain-containing protein n=1 Tax=Arctia plantaginis TaxID=874455 RepID=A0A8S0Z309_ARCPL|nr:unnamed protein product [Arctia plantaginis]